MSAPDFQAWRFVFFLQRLAECSLVSLVGNNLRPQSNNVSCVSFVVVYTVGPTYLFATIQF